MACDDAERRALRWRLHRRGDLSADHVSLQQPFKGGGAEINEMIRRKNLQRGLWPKPLAEFSSGEKAMIGAIPERDKRSLRRLERPQAQRIKRAGAAKVQRIGFPRQCSRWHRLEVRKFNTCDGAPIFANDAAAHRQAVRLASNRVVAHLQGAVARGIHPWPSALSDKAPTAGGTKDVKQDQDD